MPITTKAFPLVHLAKPEEVLEAFEKAIDLNQTDADLWDGRGWALYEIGMRRQSNAPISS